MWVVVWVGRVVWVRVYGVIGKRVGVVLWVLLCVIVWVVVWVLVVV
jgi:hypothetical protein